MVTSPKRINKRSEEEEFIDSLELDLLSIDTSMDMWSKNAKRNTQMCNNQVSGWHEKLMEKKQKAITLFKREMYSRSVEFKVEDKSSFPQLTEDEQFKERHLELVVDVIGQCLYDAYECAIDTFNDQTVWNEMKDGSTRMVVEKMQCMTKALDRYIVNATPRLVDVEHSKLQNVIFARSAMKKAQDDFEKRRELEIDLENRSLSSFQICEVDREAITTGGTKAGGTRENSPIPTLSDTDENGEVGEEEPPTRRGADGGTTAPSPSSAVRRITRSSETTTPITASVPRAFGSGSMSARSIGLLGLGSLQRSLAAVSGESNQTSSGSSNDPTLSSPALTEGGNNVMMGTTWGMLTTPLNPGKAKKWSDESAAMADTTPATVWMAHLSLEIRALLTHMAKKQGSVWKKWDGWILHEFRKALTENVVISPSDKQANTLQEAFKGVRFPLDRTNLTEWGLAQAAMEVNEKLNRFSGPVKTAESTADGRKQLFNVLGTIVSKGRFKMGDQGAIPSEEKTFKSPADERTQALRNSVHLTVSARTALPRTEAKHVSTAEGYILAVEEEILAIASQYSASPEVFQELGANKRHSPDAAPDRGVWNSKRPRTIFGDKEGDKKMKCPNPLCGKFHAGECRTPWPKGQGKGGYQGNNQGNYPGKQQQQQTTQYKPTLGMQHNNAQQQQQYQMKQRGQTIAQLQEKTKNQKALLNNPKVHRTLNALKQSDMSEEEWSTLRAMLDKKGSEKNDS